MWIIQRLSELTGLQMHSTSASFWFVVSENDSIRFQIFWFSSSYSWSSVARQPFLQQLSGIGASALVVAPRRERRQVATDRYTTFQFHSIHPAILWFPGGPAGWQNTPVSHFGGDWSWRPTCGGLGGEGTLSSCQGADGGRGDERWSIRLPNYPRFKRLLIDNFIWLFKPASEGMSGVWATWSWLKCFHVKWSINTNILSCK